MNREEMIAYEKRMIEEDQAVLSDLKAGRLGTHRGPSFEHDTTAESIALTERKIAAREEGIKRLEAQRGSGA